MTLSHLSQRKNLKQKSLKAKRLKRKRDHLNQENPHNRLKQNGNFSKRRKMKLQKQQPNKHRNKIVGVGTAMKKDILQTNVQGKLTSRNSHS